MQDTGPGANSAGSILITGCSSGIGYGAAHFLRERGWEVFATCRQTADCTKLQAEGFSSFRLDHADSVSITNGLQTAIADAGKLDAVFINGAYVQPGLTEDVPRDAMRAIFEANLFGPHQMIREILPHFRAKGGGRIVLNSSVLGFVSARGRGPYNMTKYAMEALADTLRLELAEEPIEVILIEPGPIPTEIRRKSRAYFEKWVDWQNSAKRAVYEAEFLPRLYEEPAKPSRFEEPVEAVCEKLLHAVTSPHPKPRYFVTRATWIANFIRRLLPTSWADRLLKNA